MEHPEIAAYGLDYLRFRVYSEHDVTMVQARLSYVDINTPWFHGNRYVDITGSQIELVRTVESVDVVALELSELYPCARVDVFIDVEGDLLPSIQPMGTVISNGGKVETIYSTHLKKRGDAPVFGRAYDAQRAGHYDTQVTRFEIEYKKQYAQQLLSCGRWFRNPIGVALNHIKALFGVSLWMERIEPIEFKANTKRLEHSRERFYSRYGKNILLDLEMMGREKLYEFIMECISERGKSEHRDS